MFTKKVQVGKIYKTVTDWDAVLGVILGALAVLAIIGWLFG